MTPYLQAGQLIGRVKEMPGDRHHPFVQWAHLEAGLGYDQPDELSWCGSAMGVIALLWGLPRPKYPARARHWLTVGTPVELVAAQAGFDIVVLRRGTGPQPGAHILNAPGHVGLYGGLVAGSDRILVRGGNQSNALTDAPFSVTDVLGVRRLA